MDIKFLENALINIVNNPIAGIKALNRELPLPTIIMPAMDILHWDNVATFKGWKVQLNKTNQHARILNDCNIRFAWGTVKDVYKALQAVCDTEVEQLEVG